MAIKVDKLLKVYKSNKGAYVCALKDISFNLPDTGMVFILGKSGCGKSTLLNMLGGLDSFDGGDIVVDGKSLKGSKARDFDKYRNDYVGFVFQENNLLEDKTVTFNVSLALELKSEKDADGMVAPVLDSVGLKDFESRKCNNLSGGQKQRVAIARALIKQPKLLLCDEPTGALDSETGEEIFTLLKELSQERLVVVVSHDRESAEKYGDRIIELKDGEIISDSAPFETVEKPQEKPAEKKHGNLSFKRAFTIGASYIIAKPVRMAICLILCLLTFVSVGVFDAYYSYNTDKVLLNTMNDHDTAVYTFGLGSVLDGQIESVYQISNLDESEAEEIASLLTNKSSDNDYNLNVKRCDNAYDIYNSRLNELEGIHGNIKLMLYATANVYIEADESFLKDYNLSLVAGKMPEGNDEVAIPLFFFNFYKAYGYRSNENELYKINSYEDMLGKPVTFSSSNLPTLKVTGIVDTHFRWKYSEEKLYDVNYLKNEMKDEMQLPIAELIHNALYVCKGFNEYYEGNYSGELKEERICRVIAPFEGSRREKLNNLRICNTQYHGEPVNSRGGGCYYNVNYFAERILPEQWKIIELRDFVMYVDLVMVVITAMFVLYYASGTIDEKRREIGILRALGASRWDIVKIFGSEQGIFTLGSIAVSSVISAITLIILNKPYAMAAGAELGIKFLSFGIRQFAVVLAVAILSVAVGIVFPLIKLLKKKPVDVIADRK